MDTALLRAGHTYKGPNGALRIVKSIKNGLVEYLIPGARSLLPLTLPVASFAGWIKGTLFESDKWYPVTTDNQFLHLYCDPDRECITEVVHPRLGKCFRYTIEDGDRSTIDTGSGNERACFTLEGYQQPAGTRLMLGATFLWDKFPDHEIVGIFRNLLQFNTYLKGASLPPPVEVDKAIKIDHKGVKTHHFHAVVNNGPGKIHAEWFSDPIEEGVPYTVSIAYVDGKGGEGLFQVFMRVGALSGEKKLVWEYKGVCGYAGRSHAFPAASCYRHGGLKGRDEMFVKNIYIAP